MLAKHHISCLRRTKKENSLLRRRTKARASATHHIPQGNNIPYQPLLIKPVFSFVSDYLRSELTVSLLGKRLVISVSQCQGVNGSAN